MTTDQRTATGAFPLPEDLVTPVAVVDVDVLDRNIAEAAQRARASGVALRPHAKTHKSIDIARRQLDAGAVGLTVATLAEARDLAAGGCPDLFIAYPVWAGGERAPQLRALHERVLLTVGVDGPEGATALADATRGCSTALGVLLEVDSGQHRTGVPWQQLPDLAAHCLRLGLRVRGAFTHPGHAYAAPDAPARAARDEREVLARAREALTGLDVDEPVLSGGSTPTAAHGLDGLTEVRPGTYVFGDAQQRVLTGLHESRVALQVAARVVSRPRPGEVVLDAGSKALSADRPAWLPGHGFLPDAPDALVRTLTEEHAVVTGAPSRWAVGDVVAVVPNHVCTVVHLARSLLVVSGGTAVGRWPATVGTGDARA